MPEAQIKGVNRRKGEREWNIGDIWRDNDFNFLTFMEDPSPQIQEAPYIPTRIMKEKSTSQWNHWGPKEKEISATTKEKKTDYPRWNHQL